MLYGTGKYTYELVDGWGKLPEGWSFVEVPGLAIDSQDRVYVLTSTDHPVMVFDREGNLLTSWGMENNQGHPHGIWVGPDGSVYIAYDNTHVVSKFTPDGKLLMTLGNKDQPSDTGYVKAPKTGPARSSTVEELDVRVATIKRSGPPFNWPTGVALSSSGEIYVADGYGNARVHKFSPDGTLLLSWGEPGTGPGQFIMPHGIWVDKQDRVWVCERYNRRIQIFNAQGEFLSQWADFAGQPSNICIDKDEETVYVSEIKIAKHISIFTIDGKLLARWGEEGQDKDSSVFWSPHAIAVDSHGDLYIGENSRLQRYNVDRGSRVIQKFARKT